MKKKITHFKNGENTETWSECNNIKLAPASKTIEKYWYEIIKDVFNYQRERGAGLQEVHKLFTDNRVSEGFKLYKEGKVKEGAITDVDVRATVEGSEAEHTVTMKTWKPEKLLRYRYEIERYIAELFFDCDCKDHTINGHYRNNSSMCCKHISAVLWKMMEEYDMPKFFMTEKEYKDDWYDKSKTVELDNNIKGLPMKQFSQHLNILALRDFKGTPASVAYSIHKVPNKGYEKMYPEKIPPTWITFTESGDLERIIKANIRGYTEMLVARKNSHKDIVNSIKELIPEGIRTNGVGDLTPLKEYLRRVEESDELKIENEKLMKANLDYSERLKARSQETFWELLKRKWKGIK